MRLTKVFESLYLKVFVGIVANHDEHEVVVELVKGSDVKERIAQSFPREKGIDKMLAFVETYTDESPFHYIALLNPKGDQGAIPTCASKEAEKFIDLSTSITLCQQKKWTLYAAKPDLDQLQKDYRRMGLDFIFSPFAVIQRFFQDKISSGLALYALAQHDAISVTVFQDGQLLFAEQFLMEKDEDFSGLDDDAISLSFELDSEGINEGIDLDDINAIDDLEGLDDLTDIEDLDAVNDLESFEEESIEPDSEAFETADEKSSDASEGSSTSALNEDFTRFRLIQDALNNYYTGDNFTQEFVETVYVADACGVSDELKQYLEEELFMKVYVRRIDLAMEVVDLAKIEAKHAV
jgi:hypothetical protein